MRLPVGMTVTAQRIEGGALVLDISVTHAYVRSLVVYAWAFGGAA